MAEDGFRVHVENLETRETLAANVQEVMSSLDDRETIKAAEWSKAPIQLQINVRVVRDSILEATILRAEPYERPDEESSTNRATTK